MKEKFKNTKGISMISLVVTIIVILILAGISVSVLTGDNKIIGQASNAKEQSEISEEKELIEISAIQAMGKNKYGNLVKNELQQKLDSNFGEGKAKAISDNTSFVIKIIDSNRIYGVNSNGNVTESNAVIDENPGNIKVGIDGNKLSGDEKSPFEIWCIEDLIEWSKNYSEYQDSYINLCRDLDFTSEISYTNYDTKEYEDINGDDTTDILIDEMQKGMGFTPIASFKGVFQGNDFSISKLYINIENNSVGWIVRNYGTIENLTMNDSDVNGNKDVGGIVSLNYGTIINCTNIGKLISSKGYNSGGIAASNEEGGTIISCINNGKLQATYYAGGIVSINKGTLSRCVNISDLELPKYGGGICAQNTANGKIQLCYNEGNITCSSNHIGGLVGVNAGTINSCYNSGDLLGGNYNIGGISGTNSGTINCCYNKGDIPQTTYKNAGIVATNDGTIRNCYNVGVIGKISSICGTNNSTIDKCYYKEGLLADENGIEKTEEYMKSGEFVTLLNSFIQSNEDDVDTTGYAKWINVEGDYPTLEFDTIWDGTKWNENE